MDFAYADSVDLFGIFLAMGGSSYPPPLAYGPGYVWTWNWSVGNCVQQQRFG